MCLYQHCRFNCSPGPGYISPREMPMPVRAEIKHRGTTSWRLHHSCEHIRLDSVCQSLLVSPGCIVSTHPALSHLWNQTNKGTEEEGQLLGMCGKSLYPTLLPTDKNQCTMPGLPDETASRSHCITAAVHLMCKHIYGKQPQNLQGKKHLF